MAGARSCCWPEPVLHEFTVRMAGHGFSVSATLMNHDAEYALEQLRQAHTLADSSLREQVVRLFRYFELREVTKVPSPSGSRLRSLRRSRAS